MRKIVFLFVFSFSIFLPIMSVTGDYGSTKTDKLLEPEKEILVPKTVEDSILSVFSEWQTAKASYYDSQDSAQTRPNANGVGAFGHMIKSGSIALGSSFTKSFCDKRMEVFIQIKDFNIVTPYGKGIFRVDDIMPFDDKLKGKFFIDFYHKDMSFNQKQQGRFKVKFKIIKILTADS